MSSDEDIWPLFVQSQCRDSDAAMQAAPILKRRNAARTRQLILEAAKVAFARMGYSNAGIREIAAAAGIDPVLVRRYFGSKAGLFETALIDAVRVSKDETGSNPKQGYGRFLADRLLHDEGDTYFALMTVMGEDAEARKIGDKVKQEHWLAPLERWLGPPDASARAINFTILAGGFASFVRQTRMSSEDAEIDQTTIDWFSRTMQNIVDGVDQ